jgi:hypothetical protein
VVSEWGPARAGVVHTKASRESPATAYKVASDWNAAVTARNQAFMVSVSMNISK